MPRPQKPFKKEDVLAWYASLKETLKEANINLDNPQDLFRIKSFRFYPNNGPFVGNHFGDSGEQQYAFIPKKIDDYGNASGYIDEAPIEGDATIQNVLKDNLEAWDKSFNSHLAAVEKLTKAYNEKASEEEITRLTEEVKQAEVARKQQFDFFIDQYYRQNPEYIKWMLGKQRPFNPEFDYKQIEELYAQSLEGSLYVNFPDKDVEEKWQIVVGNDGKSTFSKAGEGTQIQVNVSTVANTINDIRRGKLPTQDRLPFFNQVVLALTDYEALNGPLGGTGTLLAPFKEKAPKPVPAPTGWSWFKRIISFNLAKSDFTKYEEYRQKQVEYEVKKVQHEQITLAQYDEVANFINNHKKEFGLACPDNIKNPAMVEDNRSLIEQLEYAIPDTNPSKGIFSEGILTVRTRTNFVIMNQLQMDPESFNPDGSVNQEKTRAVWKDKIDVVPPVFKKSEDKVFSKLNIAKQEYAEYIKEKDADELFRNVQKDGLNKEIAERKLQAERTAVIHNAKDDVFIREINLENEVIEKEGKASVEGITAKQCDALSKKEWALTTFDKQMRAIGSLFTNSKDKSEQFKVGLLMSKVCVTRNQDTYLDGTSKDVSKCKVDSDIVKDLERLLDVANHPEKLEANKDLILELKDVLQSNKEEPNLEVTLDSVASIVYGRSYLDGVDVKDCTKLDDVTAFCANLGYKCLDAMKNPEDYYLDDVKIIEGKDPLSTGAMRELVFDVGETVNNARRVVPQYKTVKGVYDKFKAEKAEIRKEAIEKALEQNEENKIKEIDPQKIHRRYEPGL